MPRLAFEPIDIDVDELAKLVESARGGDVFLNRRLTASLQRVLESHPRFDGVGGGKRDEASKELQELRDRFWKLKSDIEDVLSEAGEP